MKTSIRTHLSLARVSNLPTAWANVLCAFLLAGEFQWLAFSGAIFAISLFYVAGMYLNDWRDADYDRKRRPERPIPSREISRKTVLLWALTYFAAAFAISLSLQPQSLVWAAGLLLCIAAYDLDHKENSMSPWIMAGCRALIYPWAASLSGGELSVELLVAGAAAYSYTLGLTYAARGAGETRASKLFLSICLFLPAALWGSQLSEQALDLRVLAFPLFLAWTGYCISGWLGKSWRSGPPIGHLIAGFCFVDLLAVSVATSISAATFLLFILLFLTTLKFQRIISGT